MFALSRLRYTIIFRTVLLSNHVFHDRIDWQKPELGLSQ